MELLLINSTDVGEHLQNFDPPLTSIRTQRPAGVSPAPLARLHDLFTVWLQTSGGLSSSAQDLEVGLRTSGGYSPDHQVDDAEVEHLLVRVVVRDLLLLFLNLPHQFFSLQQMKRKQPMIIY